MPILDLIVILFLDFCNVYLPICAIQIILFKKILIETVDIVTLTEEFLNGKLNFCALEPAQKVCVHKNV